VEFYSGDLAKLVHEFLAPRFGHNPDTNTANIWLVGGAKLCQSFLHLGLVDQIRLMIAPVTLGAGLPLFTSSGTDSGASSGAEQQSLQKWHLKNVVGYKNGYVELTYRRPPRDQQV
jgi:dihydrofolate reductase